MSSKNALQVSVYERGSTTPVVDWANDLRAASGITFDTYFPGGLFGPATVPIPRSVTKSWPFKIGQRLVIRNGQTVVYEGEIMQPGYFVGQGTQGRVLECAGPWETVLGRWGWRKWWADNRIGEDVWVLVPGAGADLTQEQRTTGAIRILPKAEAFTNGVGRSLDYTMPAGETIKRVKLSYDIQEAAQLWALRLRDTVGATDIWIVTASGAGVRDDTLGTPRQSLRLQFFSQAAQTPTSDGTYYGQVDSAISGANAFMVYSETGSINAQEIARDIRARVTDLNSDESLIGALTFTLEPFITQAGGWETMASILTRAVSFGDASFNSWYARLLESERAATPNGEPVLEVAQWPAVTDYDYAIRVDEKNLTGSFAVHLDGAGIANWIVARYTDTTGKTNYITPDDDANLTDAASVTAWGHRELPQPIDCGQTTSAIATNWARRVLALAKDPKFYVSGPITVTGYLRAKSGQHLPAANVQAGARLKIENFLTDEVGVAGAGMTFIVTGTHYDDVARTVSLSLGVPDNLAVFIAQLAAGFYQR